MIFRTVFNPGTLSDQTGQDRRVREIVNGQALTADGKINAYSGPKWTNVELVSLMAVNDVLSKFDMEKLATSPQNGLRPSCLDLEQISMGKMNFRDAMADINIAYEYCRRYDWQERMVDPNSGIFR